MFIVTFTATNRRMGLLLCGMVLLAAPGLVIAQSEPTPLEPIPLPAPLASPARMESQKPADQVRGLQATQRNSEVAPTTYDQTPTPAEGPIFLDQPGTVPMQDGVHADRTLESPSIIAPEIHEPEIHEPEIIVEEPYVPPAIIGPPRSSAGFAQPSRIGDPIPMTSPRVTTYSVVPQHEVIQQRTTVRAHYLATSDGVVYVPRATSVYRQTSDGRREQVTVYRVAGPFSRVAAVAVTSVGPPGDLAVGAPPGAAPPQVHLVVPPPVAQAELAAPMVPGQPIRNAVRAWAR